MSDDSSVPFLARRSPPNAGALIHYVEDMLLELAELCASAGETALAASLAIATIQAGAAGERLRGAGGQPPSAG